MTPSAARAARRLQIAAGLLHIKPGVDVQAAIRALPAARREHLRGLVDWVEEYETEERAPTRGAAPVANLTETVK